MPSKYSYNVVLSEYSSQGIISLPNGLQLDYLKQASQSRAPSESHNRGRTPSIATNSSERGSVTSKVRQHVPAKVRRYDLTLRNDYDSKRRLVIAESDSEEEAFKPKQIPLSNYEFTSQPWPKGPLYGSSRMTSKNSEAEAKLARVRAKSHPHPEPGTRQAPGSTDQISRPKSTERPKSRVGVKAFIQARHDAEVAAEATKQPDSRVDEASFKKNADALTLNEFIKTNTSRPQPRVEREMGKALGQGMSLREFIDTMPSPDVGHKKDSECSSEAPRRRPAKPSPNGPTKSLARTNPLERSPKGSQVYAKRLEDIERRESTYEPNFDGFDDENELRGCLGKPIIPAQAQLQRQRPYKIAQDAALPMRQTGHFHERPEQQKDVLESLGSIEKAAKQSPKLGLRARRDGTAKPQTPIPRMQVHSDGKNPSPPIIHTPSHSHTQSQADSIGSYQSDDSSIYGLSSIGQLTTATSRLSPSSQATTKRGTLHSWGLPRIDQANESIDEFADIFTDINHTTTLFTSDEEEEEDEADDLPTPRPQTMHGAAVAPHFGMISAGRDFTATKKDLDEMSEISEMSAVFPPDIGRYKYDGEGGPLAMAMRGVPNEAATPKRSSSMTAKTKVSQLAKSDTGRGSGILERLRIKRHGK